MVLNSFANLREVVRLPHCLSNRHGFFPPKSYFCSICHIRGVLDSRAIKEVIPAVHDDSVRVFNWYKIKILAPYVHGQVSNNTRTIGAKTYKVWPVGHLNLEVWGKRWIH
jgi:hypothetical protein